LALLADNFLERNTTMPIITRIQNPILRPTTVDDRGLVTAPKEIIVVEGGGDVPLPRPPIVVEGGGDVPLPRPPILVEGGGDVPLPRPPIVGTEESDHLVGTEGNDEIYGLGGHDTIDGLKGADKMYGGDGDDNYVVDDEKDVVVENKDEGDDTVFSTIDYHLGDNVEHLKLQGQDAINGWGNDLGNSLYGNDNSNMLVGNGGRDVLDGGKGADLMIGGDDDDIYFVDNVGDVIWEFSGQGTWDNVYSSISYDLKLGSDLEHLHLLEQGGAIDGTGNELHNTIDGNSSKNTLKGGAGNDWIDGKGGNDTMYGGEDDDTFIVDSFNDVVIEYANQGNDKVFSTATHFLTSNVETLILQEEGGAINGYGNDDAENSLYGNSFANDLGGYGGTDYIHAGGGKDTVDGGTGNDYLWGDSGNDTFRFHGTFGNDVIQDFKAGGDHDIIELDHNQFADFAAVQAVMVQGVGQTTIALDANHSIVLTGVNAADLTASDFQFV
jgi:Ca2+-binding RTX toxin-like protein